MNLKSIKPRRRVYNPSQVKRVNVYVPLSFLENFLTFKKEVYALCKQKVTLAHVFREGGSNYMRSLRVQMAKARKGVLHAKKRKDLFS